MIVISCVRTESIGFVKESERLNVALTRARNALYVVGNFYAFEARVTNVIQKKVRTVELSTFIALDVKTLHLRFTHAYFQGNPMWKSLVSDAKARRVIHSIREARNPLEAGEEIRRLIYKPQTSQQRPEYA